ncbi:TetR/AcrR family transcriptional regulator [Parenemella sanctibonifatiensis]|uniref:HTH tetR-type domain-containing protein n=1 Tax=Parenemella sanctibonifatiensis TaxID=2016505 RepID=A0A255DXH4_9ACTN|nr:TetR/AcrR family transcriptional regulator [Parenemella sanctibonifatiensis]OYN84029.1 hypothetical protein CGZ92_13290 [Parenemella sanctibonifatiensis]
MRTEVPAVRDDPGAPSLESTPSLRERHRHDTRRRIHLAALELFSTKGVRETTSQEIADLAGVSQRTYFRYFATKEEAALPKQIDVLRAVEDMELTATTIGGALREIATVLLTATRPETGVELSQHQSIMELLLREPQLEAVRAAHERELATAISAKLASQLPGESPIAIRAAGEITIAAWRTGWAQWEADIAADGDATRSADAAHQRAWRALVAIVGEVGELDSAEGVG